jgi:hypothetical protein
MASRPARNPADRVLRVRVREPLHFPDLTERRALRLSAVTSYLARAHFASWHDILGAPDFETLAGIFTPLVYVELEVTDAAVGMIRKLEVRGETFLARTITAAGETERLVREGRHALHAPDGTLLARARLVNAFTRYDPDPAKRRVITLPPDLGLGSAPTRVTDFPTLDALVPAGRTPELRDAHTRVWHYGQTDANRHVNGMEYLRVLESFVAEELYRAGHDLKRLYFARARLAYRKPCFRGEGYRCVAWVQGEAPLVLVGAVVKADEPPSARPAAAVELTLQQHEAT